MCFSVAFLSICLWLSVVGRTGIFNFEKDEYESYWNEVGLLIGLCLASRSLRSMMDCDRDTLWHWCRLVVFDILRSKGNLVYALLCSYASLFFHEAKASKLNLMFSINNGLRFNSFLSQMEVDVTLSQRNVIFSHMGCRRGMSIWFRYSILSVDESFEIERGLRRWGINTPNLWGDWDDRLRSCGTGYR